MYLCTTVYKEPHFMTYILHFAAVRPTATTNYAFKENWKSTQ